MRAAVQATEEGAADLNEAIEDRRRFESERDFLLREGWERIDELDTDTRQDLLRETLAARLGDVAGIATSPRKLAVNKTTKAALNKIMPGLAKRLFAREPSRYTVKLLDKLRKLREVGPRDRVKDFKRGGPGGETGNISKEQIKQIEKEIMRQAEHVAKRDPGRELRTEIVGNAVGFASNPTLMNAADTRWNRVDKEGVWNRALEFAEDVRGVEQIPDRYR